MSEAKAIFCLGKMPNSCDECDLSDYDDGGDSYRAYRTCLLDKRDYPEEFPVESFSGKCQKPDWCPLKAVPHWYTNSDREDVKKYIKGWNDRLDMIEGKGDWDGTINRMA